MHPVDMSNDKPVLFVVSSVHNVLDFTLRCQPVDWLEIKDRPACRVIWQCKGKYVYFIWDFLRPQHRVLKAYQLTLIQCYFIAICICIKPSQTHGTTRIQDYVFVMHNTNAYSNESAMYGRDLICLGDPVCWP